MDFFAELWTAAKQAGPFASMLLLLALYVVDKERRDSLKRERDQNERVFTGLRDATDAIRELREVFGQNVRRKP